MAVLVIQWLSGPAQGRKVTITQPVVTFGREADNTLVIAQAFVSRRHGEIRQLDGRWVLVNQSPQGTRVGRKLVKDQPQPLVDGDVVRIGDVELFAVSLSDAPADRTNSAAASVTISEKDAQAGASKASLSRRTKLWVGLIVWWVLMLGGFVFFMTLDDKPVTQLEEGASNLSNQQIEEVLLKPLAAQPPSAVDYRRHIEEGRALAGSLQASRTNLYKAYREFQSALAAAEHRRFEDDLDQLTYESLQKQLVEMTQDRYQQAYARLRAGQYSTAATEFSRLADDLYHLYRLERDNLLYQRVQAHEQEARRKAGKTK